MRLTENVLSALNIKAAAESAAKRGNDFFPSTIGFRSAISDTYVSWLTGSWRTEFEPSRPEYAVVPKFGGGTRLAIDMHVPDRLLFDGLVALIRSRSLLDLVNESVPVEARRAIEDALGAGSHEYVVLTDVVAFFDYVDRRRLIDELVDISGDIEATTALGELLEVATEGRSGIPQGLMPTATFLGDAYLSIADRVLARGGIPVIRWVDDYRFAANSLRDAFRIKTELEVVLRDLGLVIGSAKTYMVKRSDWAESLTVRRRRETRQNSIRARITRRVREEYEASIEGEEDQPDRPRVKPDRTLETAFAAATRDDAPSGAGEAALVTSRQIQLSLRELGRTGSAAPLKKLRHLLFRHPHSTKHVATYLRSRIHGGWERDTIDAIADSLASEDFPYPWQRGWLLHALVPASLPLPKHAIEAAGRAFHSSTEMSFIRGRAAVLLATEQALPMGANLGEVYEAVAPSSRGDLVVAAALMPESPDQQRFLASARRDLLNREIEKRAQVASDPFLL